MKKQWLRTSFRLKKESEERIKSLCDRSGYKQKEILDEVIRRGFEMKIFSDEVEKSETSIFPEVYKPWIDLQKTSRKTYEITKQNSKFLEDIVSVHDYLNRDQVLNLLIYIVSDGLIFPLKKERKKLLKIKPKLKRLIGLKNLIERDLTDVLGDNSDALTLLNWKELNSSLQAFERAFDKWSGVTIVTKKKDNSAKTGRIL
ncbi:hypothetical protein ACNQKP_10705 [Bdellovibrio bacteriovorus]|uniref:hypothetical protein n=1 Tax=Bdellovibrio bacteriovorus TaxID=959 RepID=UPI003AA89DDE